MCAMKIRTVFRAMNSTNRTGRSWVKIANANHADPRYTAEMEHDQASVADIVGAEGRMKRNARISGACAPIASQADPNAARARAHSHSGPLTVSTRRWPR